MKKKYTYSIAPQIALRFDVIADNEKEAIAQGENRFHVWLEKATKIKLADVITNGLMAIEAEVFENNIPLRYPRNGA